MILTTDAIVLSSRPFRDSSKILSLFTKERGRIDVIARGVSRPKSRLASVLQPMARIRCVIYLKDGRDLQNLSDAELSDRFRRLDRDLERMAAGMSIIELLRAVLQGEEQSERLFVSTLEALEVLDRETCDPRRVHLWYMCSVASALGYELRLSGCGVCDEEITLRENQINYSIEAGAPLCAEHSVGAPSRELGLEVLELLKDVMSRGPGSEGGTESQSSAMVAARQLLDAHIRFHVPGLRRLKVNRVAAAMLRIDKE